MTNELHSAGVPIDRIDHRDVARGAEVMAAEDLAPHEALTRSAVRDSLAERLVTPADVERVYSRAAGAPISPQQHFDMARRLRRDAVASRDADDRSTLLRRSNTFVSLAKMAAAQPVQPRQNSLISIPSEAYRRLGIPVAPFRADVDELEKRYAGHFGSPEDMMTRIEDTLAAPEWMIKQKNPFGPVNQVAVVAQLDDGQALVVRTQRHGDGYAVRAAYPLDPDRLAQMISGAGRAGADVVHVRPSIDGGHAPATGDRARADDATAPISPRDADRQAPTGTGGPAPPDARPPDPGGGKIQALKQNGAPSGAVFVSSDPRAGNAVNRVGYGDEPTGVPLPELGRQPVERVLDVIDERLDAYRNAPTAAARDQALDEALDAAYAHRIQGGDGAGFDRILAELSDDPSARTHARVMRERADQVVASTAGGNVRALNDSGINFGSQLQALQQAIHNDSDNAYSYIFRFASWLKSTDHLASNVPEQEAFGKLVTHMGYGRELGAARLALARRADEEIAEQRAAFARMSAAEKKAYLAERSYDNGLPWTLPDFGISAAILPFGPPPPGSRRTTKSGGGAAKQDPASERGGEQRGPPPVGLGDTSRQAPPASGAPSGAASDSAGQCAGARFGQATSKGLSRDIFQGASTSRREGYRASRC